MAALDQLRHLPVKERHQQGANVGTVHVRVRHDDDAVIAQLGRIVLLLADAAAERRDQGADLGRRQHLVEARPLHVQNLALERQDGLKPPVAALLGGSAGGIALDQEQLRERRVLLLTVGELARQSSHVQRGLAPGHLAGLARRLAGARGVDDLGGDSASFARGLQQKRLYLRRHNRVDDSLDLRGDQLVLGLRRELRVRDLHRQHRRQTLAHVVAGGLHLGLLGGPALLHVLIEHARQRRAEPG